MHLRLLFRNFSKTLVMLRTVELVYILRCLKLFNVENLELTSLSLWPSLLSRYKSCTSWGIFSQNHYTCHASWSISSSIRLSKFGSLIHYRLKVFIKWIPVSLSAERSLEIYHWRVVLYYSVNFRWERFKLNLISNEIVRKFWTQARPCFH